MPNSFIILTGMPGSGKSTIIKRIVNELRANTMTNLKGFYTEECRNEANERIGFDIKTFDGKEGILARTSTEINSKNKPTNMNYKVGKYVVYVNEFENLCMKYFDISEEKDLLVIDEIGKMELFSKKFEKAINNLLSTKSNLKILATVPLKNSHLLVEQIKSDKNSTLFHITKSNRDDLYAEILNKVKEMIK
ncbi:hypothetical protein PVAND_010748 [Polypedilum vanderplanki]|uniref:AAA+ ATPase domain-containing protein n=1 Tax=Polypedilum vanderplanki TaxID=319348 RepID=A0A9J6CGH9_POLVA|nr:hypothetical protein PVAND_010748 [Polypedilum vanderplanki]